MKRIFYLLPLIWAAVAVWLTIISPDLDQLVRERGQFDIPDTYPTAVTADILERNEAAAGEEILVVYYEEDGITAEQEEEVERIFASLPDNLNGFAIEDTATPFDGEGSDALRSDDNTTIMTVITIDMTLNDVPAVRSHIEDAVEADSIRTLVSGSPIIEDDVIISSEEGLQTTEIITVIFVISILLIVFRSIVAPFVPLLTVGATYFMTVPVVSFLIEGVDFPVSNFTQIFIVAILFGIGTDYCILLMNRFKEELAVSPDRTAAVVRTYRAVGPTVFSSALTGFIGFAAIGLADFDLYQSASGVAVGIVLLVIALGVWVPAAMLLLGEKLFWPSKRALDATDSKIWKGLGVFSIARPGWTSMLLLVLLVPAFLFYDQRLSFESLDEISSEYESVEAVELVGERFGTGFAFPAQIVLESDEPWDQSERIPIIEYVSLQTAQLEGVEEVRSFSRPDGERIEDFRIPELADSLRDGLEEIDDGLMEIEEGLRELEEDLAETPDDDASELTDAADELEDGIRTQADGAGEAAEAASELAEAQEGIANELAAVQTGLEEAASNPALDQQTAGLLEESGGGLAELSAALSETADGTNSLAEGQQELQQGLEQTADGQAELAEGQAELIDALDESAEAFDEIGEAAGELAQGVEDIREGLEDVYDLLAEIAEQPAHPLEGFYVPEETWSEDGTEDLIDAFLSPNRQAATLEVVLAVDPYSTEAMAITDEINEQTAAALSHWDDVTFSIGGLPAVNADLSTISDQDFDRTALIMLSGIFIVLIVMLRSFIMPVYILASLIGTYIISMAVTEFIFITILGYPGISWAVPFFGFVMLMALGVDYSIFLMGRFAENMQTMDVRESLVNAMTKIGTVILSAAVILAGTFGAMMPSGVLSLVQIGTLVLTGLLLYAFVMLPLFIPLMVRLFGESNWLPFKPPAKK
ncbi:MMPL family transporter [Alkalicoccus luteus]|uniref:MMPL family transporter n=1 Tax=Alkalicoccus luteus TaxID=1237094 RepID=UPI0040346096